MFGRPIAVSMIVLFWSITGISSAFAQEKPIQLSLITPIQIHSETTPIKGVRINFLYGRTTTVKGLDWGLVNHTTTGTSIGWQMGLAGLAEANFTGLQDNAINITKGKLTGVQVGFYNHGADMHGFQLGIINYAQSGRGLQIGLVNIIKQGGILPVMPLINWTF